MATQDRLPTSDAYPNEAIRYPASGDHYSKVDDTVGSHDYNSTFLNSYANNTTWYTEDFEYTNFSLPTGSTNITLTLRAYCRSESAAGPGSVELGIRVNGTWDNPSPEVISSTSFTLYDNAWTENPETSAAWTAEDINGSGSNPLEEFGFSIKGGGIYDEKTGWTYYAARCTQIYMHVEYTEPPPYSTIGGILVVEGRASVAIG